MRKIAIFLAMVLLFGTPAYAQNVHLKPPHKNPSFFDGILTLNVSGALAGLSSEDVLIVLTATADTTATCTNPAGATQPAGQNPAPTTVAGGVSFPSTEIRNGNLPFTVTTNPPTTPIAGAPECPNPRWREDITDLSFTSATITVHQPAEDTTETVVLTVTCTFDPATVNGPVPDGDVICTANGEPVS
jgi:hypothetical protein